MLPPTDGAARPGNKKQHESGAREHKTETLTKAQALSLAKPPKDHGRLDGGKEKQCACAGGQANIGKGETGSVKK